MAGSIFAPVAAVKKGFSSMQKKPTEAKRLGGLRPQAKGGLRVLGV
jgi:hypothetical protein